MSIQKECKRDKKQGKENEQKKTRKKMARNQFFCD